MFISILSCLYQISKALRLTALEKVPLDDPDLNDTFAFEDERTCLWYMSEVYNKLIVNNANKLNDKILALDLAYKEMYCLASAFSLLCLYILILYTTGAC